MAKKVRTNQGIVASKITATTIAVGTNAKATTRVAAPPQDVAGLVALVRLELQRGTISPETAKTIGANINAVEKAAVGDRKTLATSVNEIVSVFKAIGDTVS